MQNDKKFKHEIISFFKWNDKEVAPLQRRVGYNELIWDITKLNKDKLALDTFTNIVIYNISIHNKKILSFEKFDIIKKLYNEPSKNIKEYFYE